MKNFKKNSTAQLIYGLTAGVLMTPALLPAQAVLDPATLTTASSATATATVEPLSPREKFRYHATQSFSATGIAIAGFTAGIGQARNDPRQWGRSSTAYGYRYASAFGNSLGLHAIDSVLETALHEDPRYFPSAKTTFGGRLSHALLYAVVTRTDAGTERPAFARITGSFAAGQLTNVWLPAGSDSVSDGLLRAGVTLGENAGINVLKEFFPRFRKLF